MKTFFSFIYSDPNHLHPNSAAHFAKKRSSLKHRPSLLPEDTQSDLRKSKRVKGTPKCGAASVVKFTDDLSSEGSRRPSNLGDMMDDDDDDDDDNEYQYQQQNQK